MQNHKHPQYSSGQIREYLRHLSPSSKLTWLQESRGPEDDLHHLTVLHKFQLATVPFENLSLHYSPDHDVSLDPEQLYEKFVTHGRGGYCMENNAFFNAVLKGLKFSVYSTGARVSDATAGISGGGYGGWTHMVNIVKLSDGKKYMVDVGFGANVATRPLPLEEGCTCKGIFAREMRLVYENIPPNSDPTQKLWIYQYRDPPAEEWLSAFCFTEVEYLANDYTVMNFFTSHSPQSWFLKDVVILKMIMEEDELIGSLILFNGELKRKVGGKTEILEELKTEDDRLKALQSWFGIELTEVERRGIRGLVSELQRQT